MLHATAGVDVQPSLFPFLFSSSVSCQTVQLSQRLLVFVQFAFGIHRHRVLIVRNLLQCCCWVILTLAGFSLKTSSPLLKYPPDLFRCRSASSYTGDPLSSDVSVFFLRSFLAHHLLLSCLSWAWSSWGIAFVDWLQMCYLRASSLHKERSHHSFSLHLQHLHANRHFGWCWV